MSMFWVGTALLALGALLFAAILGYGEDETTEDFYDVE